MADDPTLHDILPLALQNVVDKKLTSGEKVLMTLAGASGEGLVVTDSRVIIVREQMPIVGSVSEVDCFDYSYEQIQTITVEGAVGGGHLKLALIAPPPDDHHVTLYFPSYDLAKFDAAAARIRMLIEQTRGLPLASPIPLGAPGALPTQPVCAECGSPADAAYYFCPVCGAPQNKMCGYCRRPVLRNAQFCSYCGTATANARSLQCGGCSQPISPDYAFCPRCGHPQGRFCPNCHNLVMPEWMHCARCGRPLEGLPTQPSAWQLTAEAAPGTNSPMATTAEEHNARGMSLYEQEKYAEAAREFEAALDLTPGVPLYHCNLGVAYAEMDRDDDALEEYQTAIRLAPNDPTAYLNLGYFYAERENAAEARQMWEKVIEVAPDTPEAEEARQNLANADEV